MRRIAWVGLVAFGALVCGPLAGESRPDEGGKGTVVALGDLRAAAPAAWKEEAPANQMRLAQFRLPKVKADKDDAELVVFKGFGGSARQNIERWKQQFVPPEGKKIDEVARVEEVKVGGRPASYLDVRGTYLFKARPFDPNAKAEKKADYRMLAVHFEGSDTIYHLKLTGPAGTVEHYKKGFDDWLKSFK